MAGRREAAHVFEPGTTTGTGAGLGLPLARRVARSVGGDVTLATLREEGDLGGARFVVTLPARRVAPAREADG